MSLKHFSGMHSSVRSIVRDACEKLQWTPWLRLRAGLIVLSTLLLISTWTFALLRLGTERRLVIVSAQQNQHNLTHIISENLNQILDRGSLYAVVATRLMNTSAAQAEANLSAMFAGDRAYNRFAIFDLDGRRVFPVLVGNPTAEVLAEVRSYLAEVKHGRVPALRVGELSGNQSDAWLIPLLLPLKGASNELQGVLILHLDLGYLLRLYQDIDIGRRGLIRVFDRRGVELARARRGGLEIVDRAKALGGLQGSETPSVNGSPSISDGDQSQLRSSRSTASYPFSIEVSQDLDEILQQFQSQRIKFIVSMMLLSGIILALTVVAIFLLRRQQGYFEAVVRSEQEKRSLIEQLEDEKQRAFDLASHDHLTGLANRRMFMEIAASHLARARRSRKYYALLFVDLDRFKVINDTLGHGVGDLLLQGVCQRMLATIRESDIVARFGGDEFVILLTGLENELDVVAIAEMLVDVIGQEFTNLDGHDVQVGSSIGIALCPRDGNDLETLIHHADAAMYHSKKLGRGTFTFFDQALNTNSAHEFELEQRMTRAITDGELTLHYQPIVRIADFRIVGLEALVRWQHPELGLIYPDDFIRLAEESGHIVAIGYWVFEAACIQLSCWQSEGLALVPLSVNVSARQLQDAEMPARVIEMLTTRGLSPELLRIEVTEGSILENIDVAKGILDELVAAGIRVDLDDFGKGFSSLTYIKTLPIATIKIDRAFVRDILNSSDDAIIVESTISLARNLGIRVIAEGIETRDQLIHLKTAGCSEVQGYFFSRPAAPRDLVKMLMNPILIPS